MANIQLLDQITIDKIAAGEVIERPAAVVKELVENAIDAGSTSIVIEIKEGGIAFIRITDNGCGIERADIAKAFLRHSTSKIRSIDDLNTIHSLGFRGEALSSIASVAQVELLTKRAEDVVGGRYVIHGGVEQSLEDDAMNDGTTFLVRQLFYNIPARRKFLKTPSTEASHINDLVTKLALSHPDVSFQFINNGTLKLHTSGNGNVRDIIYNVYGRDIANELIHIDKALSGIKMSGYIGKPVISRGNRNYQNYFINGRYVKSNIISKAIEDAYKGYSMQHRYPFTVLHFEMDTSKIDINVHPTKMELRFMEQNSVYQIIYNCIQDALSNRNMIPEVEIETKEIIAPEPKTNIIKNATKQDIKTDANDNIMKMVDDNKIISKPHRNTNRYGSSLTPKEEKENMAYFMNKMQERVSSYHNRMSAAEVEDTTQIFKKDNPITKEKIQQAVSYAKKQDVTTSQNLVRESSETIKDIVEKDVKQEPAKQELAKKEPVNEVVEKQLNMFEEHMIEPKVQQQYRLIGQVFDTYWMIEYKEQLYIIDQHAAHEKVLYEKTIKNWKDKEVTTQYVSPPIVLTLSMQEKQLLEENIDRFTEIGFEIEEFGTDTYAIRGVPDNLYSIAKKELFIDMLDELSTSMNPHMQAERIMEKIASMSCKAAVKGNSSLSGLEMEHLITQLLSLDNPFHCPHGRPTIIAITKKEMEKKFKRIV